MRLIGRKQRREHIPPCSKRRIVAVPPSHRATNLTACQLGDFAHFVRADRSRGELRGVAPSGDRGHARAAGDLRGRGAPARRAIRRGVRTVRPTRLCRIGAERLRDLVAADPEFVQVLTREGARQYRRMATQVADLAAAQASLDLSMLIANRSTAAYPPAQMLSASVERRPPDTTSCPHAQPAISGMSSPCRAMYSLCSISLSRIACLA